MNRSEAEAYVYQSYLKAEKHQEYSVKDSEKRRPDLTRTVIESKAGTPCVLVTGSKGKGSVCVMISQIMQTKLKVGMMTSPHITDFCERFRINGQNIPDDLFADYMTRIQPEIEAIDSEIPDNVYVSPIGIQTALALTYFNENHTDFNVFECGKGVLNDDVNNIIHQYAVINSIFLEHTRELGDTITEIAEDKSHIINGDHQVAFLAPQLPEVMEVIQKRAAIFNTHLKIYGQHFWAENIRYDNRGMRFDVNIEGEVYSDILIPLMGKHQARNCALAMALCRMVLGNLDVNAVRAYLSKMEWPGRMEVLSSDPFILLDACINVASCKNVRDVLSHLDINQITAIVGIPDDKDYAGVIQGLADVSAKIILTKSHNTHYRFTQIQCKTMKEVGINTIWIDSVSEAIFMAKKEPYPIVIVGTTSVISEVKQLFI